MNSYRPTLKSIQSSQSKKTEYRPTLQSIKPELNEYKIPEFPYVNRPPTPEERSMASQHAKSATLGAAQNYLNTPEQIANALGGHLYNKFGFAPKDKAAEVGGVAGDLASYFLPSGAVTGPVKVAAAVLPKVNQLLQAGKLAMKARPVTNFLGRTAKNVGESALFQKSKNPDSRPIDVIKAGGIGGVTSMAANALTNQNPLISTAAKLGLGGAIGYQANGIPGAVEGAGAAMFIPKMFNEMGLGQKPISAEMLTQEPNPQALAKYKASQRIGDTGTPAEVFNSPIMGARQGEIGRTESGASAMTQFGEERVGRQKDAINRLLDKIFPNTKESHNEIANLYKKSEVNNLTRNKLHDLFEDPVISHAAEKVFNDAAYSKDMKNVRLDNYAYMDKVKIAIDDMEQAAIRKGENNKARIYRESANHLTDVMDKEVPEYEMARDAAQKRIIHRQIMERLNKKPITGQNFYREFLSNENKFNDLVHDVRNVPGAKETLQDMKLSWDNLIGYDTPATAAGMTAKHTNTAREGFQKFWNEFKEMFGSPRDVERAQFIQDPNWWDKFDEVMKYKSKLERNKKLGDLIARGVSAETLTYAKDKAKK